MYILKFDIHQMKKMFSESFNFTFLLMYYYYIFAVMCFYLL